MFPNGAKRSTIPVRCDLIPANALMAVAEAMAEGAVRYGDHNWKGLPPEEILNHAMRHLYLHMAGDRKEPHLRNAAANVLMLLSMECTSNDRPRADRA